MKAEHQEFLDLFSKYLEQYPDQRLTQALFNLGVNEFKSPEDPSLSDHALRDVYSDSDASVLKRIHRRLAKLSQ
ncbi:MAG: hypothetical protein P1V35_10160 [Planctomycetota bacterium]|nr:hypothetical protein [Planctomycetota bacterium]